MDNNKKKCVHCAERSISRPRGLCQKCFYTPEIRDLYQSKVDVGCGVGPLRKPDLPTNALPGTEEKIEVMAKRLESGESAFHEMDARRKDLR